MSKKAGAKTQSKLPFRLRPVESPQQKKMHTGSSSNSDKPSPQKTGNHVTRRNLADDDRDEALNMPLEEKRKHYKCGSRYVLLDDVEKWKEYAAKLETPSVTGPKKKKSSETKAPGDHKYKADDELNKKVSLWKGDITTLEIDAIVNAANESLMGGGGVDGAIHSAAGSKLKKECARLNGCSTGHAKITAGYSLPARYVIHTVGPIGEHPRDLKSCYLESLKRMKENSLTSIAFPCISTGIYGYPNDRASRVAMKTIREWLEEDEYGPKVERVIFCLFLKVDVELYDDGMRTFFPLTEEGPEDSGSKSAKPKTADADSKTEDMEVDADAKKCDENTTKSETTDNDVEMEEKPETRLAAENKSRDETVKKTTSKDKHLEKTSEKESLKSKSEDSLKQEEETDGVKEDTDGVKEDNSPKEKKVTGAGSNSKSAKTKDKKSVNSAS